VKLIDFGISEQLDEDETHVVVDHQMGLCSVWCAVCDVCVGLFRCMWCVCGWGMVL